MNGKVASLPRSPRSSSPSRRAAAETAAPQTLPVPESISAQGVPPIPAQSVEDLLPYENIRAALARRTGIRRSAGC